MSIEYTDHPLKAAEIGSFNAPGNHQQLAEYGNLSNAVVVSATASIVILSGQVGKRTDDSIPGNLEEEYRLAFENVKIALNAAGVKAGWEAVHKLNWLFVGQATEEVTRVYSSLLAEYCGKNRPAQTAYGTTGIIWPGAHV